MTQARRARIAKASANSSEPPSLARRVSGWTSSLLATGIVLAAAVGIGRQLTLWWREVPPAPPSPQVGPAALSDEGQQPLELTFGAGYTLRRLEHSGDLDSALARLQSECREILEEKRMPQSPASPAEQRFLERTHGRTPLEEEPGKWQIHRFDGRLPLLVALVVDSLRESTATEVEGPVPQDADEATPSTRGASRPPSRVAAWGLAMPVGEDAASLLIYEAGASPTDDASLPHHVPLPAGLRRTVTLRGQGETSIGLAGGASAQATARQLDELWKARGWTATDWRQRGAAWHNRYRAAAATSGRIDIQLTDDEKGGVVGIMIVSSQ